MTPYTPFPVNGLRISAGTKGDQLEAHLRNFHAVTREHGLVAVMGWHESRPFTLAQYEARRIGPAKPF